MSNRHEILFWLKMQFDRVGFKAIKDIPLLDVIFDWSVHNKQVHFFQLFINHDSRLTLYLRNEELGKSLVFTYGGEYIESDLLSPERKTEEEIVKIMIDSKAKALEEPLFLKEKERLELILNAKKSGALAMGFDQLKSWYSDSNGVKNIDFCNENEVIVCGCVLQNGDSVLFNSKMTRCIVFDDQKVVKADLGDQKELMQLSAIKKSKWVFFTTDLFSLYKFSQITNGLVVYYEPENVHLSDFIEDIRVNFIMAIFCDNLNKALIREDHGVIKQISCMNTKFTNWRECIGGEEDITVIRSIIKETVSATKSCINSL